ncbi:MAG: L-threonylcarbamoyladenylate synthase [Patescibacteria group bacterium]|jgi:L-threonylcarbamoyladenylate synthase
MPVIFVHSVAEAAKLMRSGEMVVYPTETSYGLGVDPSSQVALKRIFAIKGRDRSKPLSLIAASLADAKRYVSFSPWSLSLAKKNWPGALTLILPARQKLFAKRLGSKDGTIAIRVSELRQARSLARMVGGVITATSANRSGAIDSYTERAVFSAFADRADNVFFLASGSLPRRRPSTILRVHGNLLTVLRQGSVRIAAKYLIHS